MIKRSKGLKHTSQGMIVYLILLFYIYRYYHQLCLPLSTFRRVPSLSMFRFHVRIKIWFGWGQPKAVYEDKLYTNEEKLYFCVFKTT